MITKLKEAVQTSLPIVWVATTEEARVRAEIRSLFGARATFMFREWDCVRGTGKKGKAENVDPEALLSKFFDSSTDGMVVLSDFHVWLNAPGTVRLLKNHATDGRERTHVVVILAPPGAAIPVELAEYVYRIDWAIPSRTELEEAISDLITTTADQWSVLPGKAREYAEALRADLAPAKMTVLVDACVGMTLTQMQRALAFSLTRAKRLNPKAIADSKAEAVRLAGLEWRSAEDMPGFEAVGGLDKLKEWAKARGTLFSRAARDWGVPPPRGLFLAGVPGGGKSHIAGAIAGEWGLPLLRLDLGALRSKFVGDSEANIRKALDLIGALAPCVCFIDEIDKAMAGASGAQGDGGVSADALGVILTWMQERKEPVFVIATANNVEILPPELLRAGRFDAVFYVDLPETADRIAILETQWRMTARAKTDPAPSFDAVAAATDKFSGAELREVVQCGLIEAFNDGGRAPAEADFLGAAREIRPLATISDKVESMRRWGKTNARPASVTVEESAKISTRVNFDEEV